MNATQVALVTGASRGIGAAIARRLAHAGFRVVVCYRSSNHQASQVLSQIRDEGGVVEAVQADLRDLDQVRALISNIGRQYRRLDVLVNNAGRSEDGLLLLTSAASWWNLVNDNLAPTMNCTKAALPLLLASRNASIINISSVSGLRGVEGQTAYSTAKAAVIGFTRSLAVELAKKGVSVNCVAPGPIDTEMYARVSEKKRAQRLALLPLSRLGTAEEVAELVCMLAERRCPFIHGQVIAVDGGLTA